VGWTQLSLEPPAESSETGYDCAPESSWKESIRWGGGVAIPVRRARIAVAGVEASTDVGQFDECASFKLSLPQGPAHLQTWLETADGRELGAYYVYVERVEPRFPTSELLARRCAAIPTGGSASAPQVISNCSSLSLRGLTRHLYWKCSYLRSRARAGRAPATMDRVPELLTPVSTGETTMRAPRYPISSNSGQMSRNCATLLSSYQSNLEKPAGNGSKDGPTRPVRNSLDSMSRSVAKENSFSCGGPLSRITSPGPRRRLPECTLFEQSGRPAEGPRSGE